MNSLKCDTDQDFNIGSKQSEIFSAILRRIGGHGTWQWIIFIITSYSGTALALGNLSAAFIAGVPEHWCKIPNSDRNNFSRVNFAQQQSTCEYFIFNGTASFKSPDLNELSFGSDDTIQKVQCTSWEYDDKIFHNTIVTEWDLVCNDKWKTSTAQAIFMLGVLTGGCFLSELSDIYGRRRTILLSTVFSIASTAVVILSNNYITFVVLRFASAIFVTGVFLPSFVLFMEIIDSNSRTVMGMLFQIPFSIGLLILPALAAFIKTWRYLQAAITALTSLMILNYWFVPESPRWLLLKGETGEALKILKKGAHINGSDVYDELALQNLVMKINPVNHIHSKRTICEQLKEFASTLFKLVKTPIIRRRTIILCYQYFVVATVYYGLTLASSTFNTTPHIMLTIGGMGDIFGLVIAIFFLYRFGRRNTLSLSYILSGAACVLILFIPASYKWVIIGIVTFGKLTNSMAFGVVFIYSAELMPTPIRNVALGIAALFARLGSALVPYILDMLGEMNPIIPPTLFGLLSITAGGFTLLLPESANKPLPETIEEVEMMKK